MEMFLRYRFGNPVETNVHKSRDKYWGKYYDKVANNSNFVLRPIAPREGPQQRLCGSAEEKISLTGK